MQPSENASLVDIVYAKLLEDILGGRLAAGEKLSEPRISAALQVSRAPVREAIRRLEERQLVTHRPRQGVRVIAPDDKTRSDLMSMRAVLEGLAAREAARSAGQAAVAGLTTMLEAHGRTLRDSGPLEYWQSAANSDFHHRVAVMSGNDFLIDLINDRYWPVFQLVRRARRDEPGRIVRAYEDHCRIASAIRDADGDLAQLLMRRHIEAAMHN